MISFSRNICLIILLSILFTTKTQAQNGGINGWIKKKTDKINQSVNKVLNGSSNTNTDSQHSTNQTKESNISNTQNNRPLLSEIKDEDFVQNESNPVKDPNYTRFKIAKNLLIDIRGKYPNGYEPKWRFISYPSQLSVDVENWYYPNSRIGHENYDIAIGEYNNKGVLRFHPFPGCECFADIVTIDSVSVITTQPQTYQLTNFRKILNDRSTGEPCRSMSGNIAYSGGFEGKLTLSANENGDILMNFFLENYSEETKKRGKYNNSTRDYDYSLVPSKVARRYLANNITIENEMSAEKATAIILAEQEAKQRQKDYVAKTTKQADSLQKIFAKRYPTECRTCFYSSRGSYISSKTVDEYYVHSGDYAGSRTDYDINTVTVIKNKCNYNIMFIGIQQLYDENNGYYLKEITKTMPAGYNYSSDQGMMSSIFTSLIGGGSEFNFAIQDKYAVSYAYVNSVQWLKVVKTK